MSQYQAPLWVTERLPLAKYTVPVSSKSKIDPDPHAFTVPYDMLQCPKCKALVSMPSNYAVAWCEKCGLEIRRDGEELECVDKKPDEKFTRPAKEPIS